MLLNNALGFIVAGCDSVAVFDGALAEDTGVYAVGDEATGVFTDGLVCDGLTKISYTATTPIITAPSTTYGL